jgi:hypothetical protein
VDGQVEKKTATTLTEQPTNIEKEWVTHSAVKKNIVPKKSDRNTKVVQDQSTVHDPANHRKEIVQDLIELLDAKLDPVLQSVEQRWQRTVEQLDSKLSHIQPPQNDTEPKVYGVEQQIQTEKEEMELIVIPNTIRGQEEPVSSTKPSHRLAFEDTIEISREVIPSKTPIRAEEPRKPFLVLPSSVISTIQERKNIRQKFGESYFGYTDSFHPSMALAS